MADRAQTPCMQGYLGHKMDSSIYNQVLFIWLKTLGTKVSKSSWIS